VLFLGSETVWVDACVRELNKAQYTVDPVCVLTLAQGDESLRSQSFDLVVAEYPSLYWRGSEDLKLLHQTMQEIPLLFLVAGAGSESMGELTAHGVFDWLDRAHLTQLPMLVRRILNEKRLQVELEEAGKALEHSQSQYRALVDNPAYGILCCDVLVNFLYVN
jgi:DNA-binding NtrC family response regulator